MTDPYPIFDYLTLTQLGSVFGVSATASGSWLAELGLRRITGVPAQKAIDAGIAVLYQPETGGKPFWVWAKDRTIRILENAGHKRIGSAGSPGSTHNSPLPPPAPATEPEPKLLGPFTARNSHADSNGYEIADTNGVVAIWCRGHWLTKLIVKLLNICFETKKYFC